MRIIRRVNPPLPTLTLRQFYERRNTVLIVREVGGLGDLLMHRMMFEDFKTIHPDIKIVFACPPQYHAALQDHPYIDELFDSKTINTYEYIISYNTTTACTRYEVRVAPFSGEHRSDIWAGHCGIKLKHHNMHINIPEEAIQYGQNLITKTRNNHPGPVVLLAPVSAMLGKNLNEIQLQSVVTKLRKMHYFVCALHTTSIPILKKMDVPVFHNVTIPNWMGIINAVDYVISVDTAAFHFAGGIGKPVMGIFTFADGKIYGKYYDHILVQKHRDDGDWDCGPCYDWSMCPKSNEMPRPCLTKITPNMLEEGIEKMFKKWPNHRNTIKLEWDK